MPTQWDTAIFVILANGDRDEYSIKYINHTPTNTNVSTQLKAWNNTLTKNQLVALYRRTDTDITNA